MRESEYAEKKRIRRERDAQRQQCRDIEGRIEFMRFDAAPAAAVQVAQLALRAARLRLWSMARRAAPIA